MRRLWSVVLLLALWVRCLGDPTEGGSDEAWDAKDRPYNRPPRFEGMGYSSRYLTMRDGVKIAIDLHLPEGLPNGERIPAIIRQTRYLRSMELRWLPRLILGTPYDHTTLYARRRRYFVTRGYAWVDVDVRGSGASFGSRSNPWSPDEIQDGGEIVDWITNQPWSSGKVGATGISYPGSTAELLLVNKHPAVRGVAPRFALFDSYTDIPFPGGIHAIKMTEDWHRQNDALDRNAAYEIAGWWTRLFVTGVSPVMEDLDRSLLAAATRAHGKNGNVHAEALQITYKDDLTAGDAYHRGDELRDWPDIELIDTAGSIGLFSPHNFARHTQASGAAIYSYSGWFDGAYVHAAIKRYLTVRTPGSRLILGPWSHGGGWHINPLTEPTRTEFDHDAELLRFFDYHLAGIDTGISEEERLVQLCRVSANTSGVVWNSEAVFEL